VWNPAVSFSHPVFMAAQTLPREVLRWIQSLDLAYSVKNVKRLIIIPCLSSHSHFFPLSLSCHRDFSNGFLVAEIFSRYYAKDIQMHSFDNGTALTAKRDNWNQLQKFFRKIGINELISDDEVGRIIRCEDGVAIQVITKIYESLTQRKVQPVIKKPTNSRVAGYAKDTGAWKVRETLRKGGFGDESDLNTVSKVSRDASEEHEKEIHAGRSMDPERFASVSIAVSNSQMPPRVYGEPVLEETPQVRVKEIQVKQLDRNVTHLRASKQMSMQSNAIPGGGNNNNGNLSPSSRHIRAVTPSGTNGYDDSASQLSDQSSGGRGGGLGLGPSNNGGGMLPENAVSLLNSCISRVMGPHNIPSWNSSLDALQNCLSLLETLHSAPQITSARDPSAPLSSQTLYDLINSVLSEIRMSTQQLADASVMTPKQYWKISDLLISVLIHCNYQSKAYQTAVETFESLGKYVNQKDPKSSLYLFCDFSLFKLSTTLHSHPYKRLGILRVLYSFSSHDTSSHIQCIKRLQHIISNIHIFIHCLTILSSLEQELDMSLLDLYQYYAIIGLGIPSPKIRAGAASVICNLYPLSGGMISPVLPQLQSLAETESWWEIQCHLLTLTGHILEARLPENINQIDPATEDATLWRNEVTNDENYGLNFMNAIFTRHASKIVKQWGLVVLARAVGYGDEISGRYLEILESLEVTDRKFLLDLSSSSLPEQGGGGGGEMVKKIPLPSSTGIDFILEPITSLFNPLVIVRAIESKIINDKLERISGDLMQILHACVRAASQSNQMVSLHKPASLSSADEDVFQIALVGSWIDIYNSLKDFIFVGLCDSSCVEDATGILIEYILRSPQQDAILSDNKFLSMMRLIYPTDGITENHKLCQVSLEAFFEFIFSSGEFYSGAVINTIEIFAKNYTNNYEMSNLQQLMKYFLSQVNSNSSSSNHHK
jgi:hypothetical protein